MWANGVVLILPLFGVVAVVDEMVLPLLFDTNDDDVGAAAELDRAVLLLPRRVLLLGVDELWAVTADGVAAAEDSAADALLPW